MADKEIEVKYQLLKTNLCETQVRIRRYTLDPRLKSSPPPHDDTAALLRAKADEAWLMWLAVRDELLALPPSPTLADLNRVEKSWLQLERQVDLIQRELISEKSFVAGMFTVGWMLVVLIVLILLYLVTHGVRSFDFSTFEPWPEWGPLKYAEVVFWSLFGVFCWLLFLATYYLARRDFDKWYQPWYVSTAIRAPFLSVMLMMIILEFVEWYGEGTWIQTYVLKEGNKFYFILFVSFCLGLTSEATSAIIRDLAAGVTEFVRRAVGRVSQKVSLAVSKPNLNGK